ncbi:MAG: SLC45 family MFS transporter [Chloroflexi bacterium]|nr:SLC45 family MFS transporter [Chloroflexota bacterium]
MTTALQEPTQPVTLTFQVLLGLASASALLAIMVVLSVLLPVQVARVDPAAAATNLAVVLPLGAFGALVGNPLGGALSDRTTSRFGRRRPWIVIGALATAAGLLILAGSQMIAGLALGWFMVQFFGNMLMAAHSAILPDRVPAFQRGATQAILGLISPVMMIGGAFYLGRVTDFRAGYGVVIAVLLACNALFAAWYREPRLPAGALPRLRIGAFLASFWINPRRQPNFARVWLVWLFLWTGYIFGSGGFLFLYVQNVVGSAAHFPGLTVQEAMSQIQIVQTAVGVPLMMLAAFWSDRLQRRKVFIIAGGGLVIAGLIGMALSAAWGIVLVATTTIGVGFRFFFSLGQALATQILPSAADRGKDLGVLNIASTVPQVILPGLGAALLNSLGVTSPMGYAILFLSGALSTVAGLLLLPQIRGVR